MTSPQQKEYFLVTDEELVIIWNGYENTKPILDRIRSHLLSEELKKERERVLDELERIAQHNWEEIETDEGEIVRMCFCGELIGKIEELRGEP
jgi:hypothetical protein